MDYHTRIETQFYKDTSSLWLYAKTEREVFVVKPLGELVFVPVKDLANPPPPTLELPGPDCKRLLAALARDIVGSGIEVPQESFVKGKLEAVERHLADMRRLLKLP